jgi:hypothetical protein
MVDGVRKHNRYFSGTTATGRSRVPEIGRFLAQRQARVQAVVASIAKPTASASPTLELLLVSPANINEFHIKRHAELSQITVNFAILITYKDIKCRCITRAHSVSFAPNSDCLISRQPSRPIPKLPHIELGSVKGLDDPVWRIWVKYVSRDSIKWRGNGY